ncbi:MAG: hypothetical protein QG599_1995 [Pseudomonadota bacterium]|nr:hypothetical protein [Pseudomonadota bacterium]
MLNSVHSATGHPAGLPPSGQPDASPNSADTAQFQQAMNAPANSADDAPEAAPDEKKDSLLEEMQGNIFSQVCRSMMENQRKLKENLDELRN